MITQKIRHQKTRAHPHLPLLPSHAPFAAAPHLACLVRFSPALHLLFPMAMVTTTVVATCTLHHGSIILHLSDCRIQLPIPGRMHPDHHAVPFAKHHPCKRPLSDSILAGMMQTCLSSCLAPIRPPLGLVSQVKSRAKDARRRRDLTMAR